MKPITQEGVIDLIRQDKWMMDILRAARSLHLPDWMIGAGFVRNKVWDALHGYERKGVDTADIDLIYFDPTNLSEEYEKELDQKLKQINPANWSVKNQARMHIKHGRLEPYKNSLEALSEWVETATCVAVRLEDDDSISFFAPYGIEDLVNLILRPAPFRNNDRTTFMNRVTGKQWMTKWPKLRIADETNSQKHNF